jgi:hypothetical protein
MSTAVMDKERCIRLDEVNAPLEIQSAGGEVVGHYLPEAEYRRLLYAVAEANCPISEQEWEQRRQEKGGVSLEEILKKLGA